MSEEPKKTRINECPCDTPGWCEEYEIELTPRKFDICRGFDDDGNEVLTFKKRLAYKELWIRQRDNTLMSRKKPRKNTPVSPPPRRRNSSLPKPEDLIQQAREKEASQEIIDQQPGVFGLTGHFAKAVLEHTKNNIQYVTQDELARRLSKCVDCEFMHKGRCLHRKCGCRIWVKAKWKSEKCPKGKWDQ